MASEALPKTVGGHVPISTTDLHVLADAQVREQGLISHCLDSFNELLPKGLEQFLTQFNHMNQTVSVQRRFPNGDEPGAAAPTTSTANFTSTTKTSTAPTADSTTKVITTTPTVTATATGNPDDIIDAVRYEVEFGQVTVRPPEICEALGKAHPRLLYPLEALRLERTYAGETTVIVTVRAEALNTQGGEERVVARKEELRMTVPLGALPIMVGSQYCNTYAMNPEAKLRFGMDPHDQGGYFIVQGREWVVDAVENHVYNQPNIYRNLGHEREVTRLEMISKPGDFYENSSEIIIILTLQKQLLVQLTSCEYFKNGVQKEKSAASFPFFVFFRLFGRSDKEIFDIVLGEDRDAGEVAGEMATALKNAMTDAVYEQFPKTTTDYQNPYELQQYLAEQLVRRWPQQQRNREKLEGKEGEAQAAERLAKNLPALLDKFFLPHLGDRPEARLNKLRHFGHLIHQLLLVKMEVVESTDRDNIKNKRVHAAGQQLSKKFKQFISKYITNNIRAKMRKHLESTAFNRVDLRVAFRDLSARKFQKELVKEIVTSMRLKKGDEGKKRPLRTEELHRKNQLNTLNTLRVVRAPNMASSRKDERARVMRYAHSSYPGWYCMLQTADTGEEVGVVKALGLNTFLSKASDSGLIKLRLLLDPDLRPFQTVYPLEVGTSRLTLVKVNGEIIACCHNPFQIVRRYRELRRGFLSKQLLAALEGRPQPAPAAGALAHLLREEFVPLEDVPAARRSVLPVLAGVTVHWDPDSDQLHFWADQGRLLRPLLVVRNNGPLDPLGQRLVGHPFDHTAAWLDEAAPLDEAGQQAFFTRHAGRKGAFRQQLVLTPQDIQGLRKGTLRVGDLVQRGVLDYIAPIEAQDLLVAPCPEVLARAAPLPVLAQYTHCEIPVSLLGLPALTCPYANCNQTPRITFQTNQSKQTCGWYALNWARRPDKLTFLQWSNEVPLTPTLANNFVYPNGQTAIVAISAAYLANNQEDSLESNDTASQRGLYMGQHFNVWSRTLDKEVFGTPLVEHRRQRVNYSKLQQGKVPVGTFVKQDDALLGISSTSTAGAASGGSAGHDSVIYTAREDGRVEDLVNPPGAPEARNFDDREFCKVKISNVRVFGIGQKFSSRHGQKGMTGSEQAQVDMYFTEDGLSPDLVMSSHAIPSRMTVGQLIESVDSVGAALLGRLVDRSAFTPVDLRQIGDTLVRCGWTRHGSRPMYSGRTGEFIDADIFIGPTYYQRLQKYVEDELYNADVSSIDLTTHQPREGKKVKGGLRLGEMEKDTIMANGCCLFLMENFRDNSDKYDLFVCRLCGQLAIVNPDTDHVHCKRCASLARTPDVYRVRSTWSSKLWLQELETAGVGVFLSMTPHVQETSGSSPYFAFRATQPAAAAQ